MIAVVDYDTGNIRNLMKALDYVGLDSKLTDDPEEILNADGVILPGVGAFAEAMDELRRRNLIDVLNQVVDKQIPLLGICLGMQLLFENSEEFGLHDGLGFLPGTVKEIPATNDLKVPEMGWNENKVLKNDSYFSEANEKFTYFVHSYYASCPLDIVTAGVDYGVFVPSIVQKNKVIGMQFHPEKSSDVGLGLLQNYKRMVQDYVDSRN
ncbi:imidazole glycerol phosphate synthase subunit HisH [Paucilactobacillus suebicus]|uniref:Imidazole glycerol phosphate synthase subunit HisH n=1 Tax=Paucilactobacillus suebicus DSM 5007 = KCTC 3549 TaxID=1423807 RepID=A0A0R1W4D9_9LACO|nr:imidazole glycerol phosphate synthase subunit HisH [Paucilactobacillus suebicus]KRM12351.1 imidazole glycerol phosphate synthase subunit HisH [Paucilactobacillus suebicus DSM 5007 = KCTC 3549]